MSDKGKGKQNYNLLIKSEILRVLITFIILQFLSIPFFIKILLIMFTEILDCTPSLKYGPLFTPDTSICGTTNYQRIDKITDIIIYFLILVYIINSSILSPQYNYFIIFLFIVRLIGTYFFLEKRKGIFLCYFPNFFLETSLALMVIHFYPIFRKYTVIIIICILILKVCQEFYMHYENKNENEKLRNKRYY